jgi:hypothetical protein
MHFEPEHRGHCLVATLTDRTLVMRPDWGPILDLQRQETRLTVLDLGGVDFISSLFLEGCVALGRTLAGQGRELALLGLSPHQEQLLQLVEGSYRLRRFGGRQELRAYVGSLRAPRESPPGARGLTREEKFHLWG